MPAPALILLADGSTDPRVGDVVHTLRVGMQSMRPEVSVHVAFLDHCPPSGPQVVSRLARQRPVVVNLDDVRTYNREYADGLLNDPNGFMPPFENALKALVDQLHDPLKDDIKGKQYHIGLRGSFGDHHVNTRMLRSFYLGKMISLEGIVTRCTYRY